MESPAALRRCNQMRSAALALMVLIPACHHGRARPATGGTGVPPAGALMHGLFAADRTLVYDVTSTSSLWDDEDPAADADGYVETSSTVAITCHLTVGQVAPYRTARIACDLAGAAGVGQILDELVRVFATDGDRLWRLDTGAWPPTVHELTAATRAAPVLVQEQQPVDERHIDSVSDDGGPGDFGTTHEVTAEGDGWCVADGRWGEDGGGTAWCLSATHGLVSASWSFSGDVSLEKHAVLRRP